MREMVTKNEPPWEGRRNVDTAGDGGNAVFTNDRQNPPKPTYRERFQGMDASKYLAAVRERFEGDEKYEEFLACLRSFRSQEIDEKVVVDRVKNIFDGQSDLLLGFNMFLPPGEEIRLTPESEDAALKQLEKVMKALDGESDEPEIEGSPESVPDLKQDPKACPQNVYYADAMSFVQKIKDRFQGKDVFQQFVEILDKCKLQHVDNKKINREIEELFRGHDDLLDSFIKFIPHAGLQRAIHEEQRTPVDPSEQNGHDNRLSKESSGSEEVEAAPREVEPVKTQRRSSRRPETNLREKKPSGAMHAAGLKKALALFDKIHRHISDASFSKFLKRINKFCRGELSGLELSDYANRPLKAQRSLNDSFDHLLSDLQDPERVFGEMLEKLNFKPPVEEKAPQESQVPPSNHGELYEAVVTTPWRMKKFNVSISEWDSEQKEDPELVRKRMINMKHKDYYKPVSEHDISSWKQCSPSYKFIPDDYPKMLATTTTPISKEVINDRLLSITRGSEDYSLKFMRKNPHEDALFRCEDDHLELDLLIFGTISLYFRIYDIFSVCDATDDFTDFENLADNLMALHHRCIERIYGDHGADILEQLRRDPKATAPVLVVRIKEKLAEWFICRPGMLKVFKATHLRNDLKARDHRGKQFKVDDLKTISSKAMIGEIKEMHSSVEHAASLLMDLANRRIIPEKPELEFEYSDPCIHKDVHALLDLSTSIIYAKSPDQKERTMKLWGEMVETFLAVDDQAKAFATAKVAGEEIVVKSRDTEGKIELQKGLSQEDHMDIDKAVACTPLGATVRGSAQETMVLGSATNQLEVLEPPVIQYMSRTLKKEPVDEVPNLGVQNFTARADVTPCVIKEELATDNGADGDNMDIDPPPDKVKKEELAELPGCHVVLQKEAGEGLVQNSQDIPFVQNSCQQQTGHLVSEKAIGELDGEVCSLPPQAQKLHLTVEEENAAAAMCEEKQSVENNEQDQVPLQDAVHSDGQVKLGDLVSSDVVKVAEGTTAKFDAATDPLALNTDTKGEMEDKEPVEGLTPLEKEMPSQVDLGSKVVEENNCTPMDIDDVVPNMEGGPNKLVIEGTSEMKVPVGKLSGSEGNELRNDKPLAKETDEGNELGSDKPLAMEVDKEIELDNDKPVAMEIDKAEVVVPVVEAEQVEDGTIDIDPETNAKRERTPIPETIPAKKRKKKQSKSPPQEKHQKCSLTKKKGKPQKSGQVKGGNISTKQEGGKKGSSELPESKEGGSAEERVVRQTKKKGEKKKRKKHWISFDQMVDRYKTYMPVAVNAGRTAVPDDHPSQRVLYGDDVLYVMFRLHYYLYSRVKLAKDLSEHPDRRLYAPADKYTDEERYKKYMELLFNLLEGTILPHFYEDECRKLLGVNSFLLFTMDKLIYKLMKQLESATNNESMANRLIGLHAYSLTQANYGILEQTYHANADLIIGKANLYRFAHNVDGNGNAKMSVHLLDPLDKSKYPISVPSDGKFAHYLYQYLNTIGDPKVGHKIFLNRNRRRMEEFLEALHAKSNMATVVDNRLECKFVQRSKVQYVLESEDFFALKGKRKSSALSEASSKEEVTLDEMKKYEREKRAKKLLAFVEEKLKLSP